MMQEQVVAIADVDELAIVARQRFQPIVSGLDEDLGLVPGRSQDSLNPEHLVTDRISVSQRREDLVDLDQARLRPCPEPVEGALGAASAAFGVAGPVGSCASTSSAAGRSCRRRSNQPGSGSRTFVGASFFSRSNMSRYLRSMTGQSYCSRKN